jgi:hypothetical protein
VRPCIIHNAYTSHWANLMMMFMAATKIRSRAEGAVLSNYDMPYWNISVPAIFERSGVVYTFSHEYRINIDYAAYLANSGEFSALELKGYFQRMENFVSPSEANALFVADESIGLSFGEEFIVCPVRGAEILAAIHPGYTLIPIEFYAEIFAATKLRPVFCGQTEDNVYMNELRRRFPDSVVVPPQGPLADFQTIRKARNIVVSVSTFSWLAAWLSDASAIYLPVYGLFNPLQFPHPDLLPLGDRRYRFYLFPLHNAVPVEQFVHAHAELRWTPLPSSGIAQIKVRADM